MAMVNVAQSSARKAMGNWTCMARIVGSKQRVDVVDWMMQASGRRSHRKASPLLHPLTV